MILIWGKKSKSFFNFRFLFFYDANFWSLANIKIVHFVAVRMLPVILTIIGKAGGGTALICSEPKQYYQTPQRVIGNTLTAAN